MSKYFSDYFLNAIYLFRLKTLKYAVIFKEYRKFNLRNEFLTKNAYQKRIVAMSSETVKIEKRKFVIFGKFKV